jgi:undecaprenyl-diphosphatase
VSGSGVTGAAPPDGSTPAEKVRGRVIFLTASAGLFSYFCYAKDMVKKIINTLPSWPLFALLFVIFLTCSIFFVAIADEVLEGETLRFDEAILTAINGTSNAFWDTFFSAITHLGGAIGVIVIAGIIASALFLRKKYREIVFLGVGVGGAALLNVVLKLIFERPRPDLWEQLIVETSFSFPSGHAMASSALAFAVIIIAWNTKLRWYAIGAGALFVLVVGFSRLYLGVHYPTDVMAGWFVSAVWVLLVALVAYARSSFWFGIVKR